MVCHTAHGGKQFAGGLGFKLPFGTLYSTNITPDKETGIGNYSDQDFLNAVHRGIRRDGARLYPAMPYTSYTYMTDADTLAIKAYLFSLHAGARDAAGEHAGLSVQSALGDGFWSGLFNPDTRFEPDTSQSAGMEPRRLSGRSARALRRMPYAAQSRVRARQPQEVRRRRHRRLARLQHHVGQGHRRRRLERRRSRSPISRPDMPRATAPRRDRWAKRSTTASASWRRKISTPWSTYLRTVPAIASQRSARHPGAAGIGFAQGRRTAKPAAR